MTKQQLNTLLVLADRARRAGLIEFQEMPAVLDAIQAANKYGTPEGEAKENESEQPKEGKNGKRDTVNN